MKLYRVPVLCGSFLVGLVGSAQVVPANEVIDAGLRSMQQRSMPELQRVAQNIRAHKFDHDFFCTRQLDIDEEKERQADQHSIRFEHFQGVTVLAISGNYYGAYAADRLGKEQRLRQTFLSVILPLAKASVPEFAAKEEVQGFAFEVSHHVNAKVMGAEVEGAENVMVYLPRAAAIKLVSADDMEATQAALLNGEVFLNATPINLWLTDNLQLPIDATAPARLSGSAFLSTDVSREKPQDLNPPSPASSTPEAGHSSHVVLNEESQVAGPALASISPPVLAISPRASLPAISQWRDVSPAALAGLQAANQVLNEQIVRQLDRQAHFVSTAPPVFIAFRQQIYLELSLTTQVNQGPAASRYKLAALTFEDHIAPLIRPVLSHFSGQQEFDGITFSSSVSTAAKSGVALRKLSVEFFFPFAALHGYESYDITGQQLLDSGIILINGERVGVSLEQAEADAR